MNREDGSPFSTRMGTEPRTSFEQCSIVAARFAEARKAPEAIGDFSHKARLRLVMGHDRPRVAANWYNREIPRRFFLRLRCLCAPLKQNLDLCASLCGFVS